ncbi:MAG: hypothetical protein L0241_28905, partial [Planctomycetia bacterium]|nr:hypothetical protein [Planctomycetia bacterium]
EDIGGDHQRIEMTDTRYLGVTFKHCLLPVWVANYRYHEKLFQILINGRTGKVSGERPWSWMKILRLVAIIVLVVGAIIALVMTFSAKKSGSGDTPRNVPTLTATKSVPASMSQSRVAWDNDVRLDSGRGRELGLLFGDPEQHIQIGADKLLSGTRTS